MRRTISPLCLLLALAMLVAGFGLWTVEPPAATVELYRAAAEGDDQYREAAEAQINRRQRGRKLLVAALFGASALMIAIAFLAMQPARDAS